MKRYIAFAFLLLLMMMTVIATQETRVTFVQGRVHRRFIRGLRVTTAMCFETLVVREIDKDGLGARVFGYFHGATLDGSRLCWLCLLLQDESYDNKQQTEYANRERCELNQLFEWIRPVDVVLVGGGRCLANAKRILLASLDLKSH